MSRMGRWARRSDTRLQLAHFVHHRPHGGDRKRRLADRGDPTGGPKKPRRPGRSPGGWPDRAGLHHSNPVAKALGQVGLEFSLLTCTQLIIYPIWSQREPWAAPVRTEHYWCPLMHLCTFLSCENLVDEIKTRA